MPSRMSTDARPSTTRRSGQIQRRGGAKWLVRVFAGRDESGRRRYESKTIHGSKRDAERVLGDLLRRRDQGELLGPERLLTLNGYLDRWLAESVGANRRPRTLEDYRRFLDRYARPALGARKLETLTAMDLQGLVSSISRETSPHAAARTHRVLSAALRQAVKWRLLSRSPSEGVTMPREARSERTVLTAEQAARFAKEAARRRHGLIYTLTLATGMRPAEVQALRWRDVDLDAGELRIERALVWLDNGRRWEIGEPKTKLSRRAIPLPRFIVRDLGAYRAEQARSRLRRAPNYVDHGLVFASRDGGPMHRRNLRARVFLPIITAADLPTSLRWYDLRHTCATLLLAAGENPRVVSERLGHSTVAFTLDRYAHVLPGMQQAASDKLNAILG